MQKVSLACITPKTSYYRTDGTGRDTYISFDNGGCCARMTSHASTSIPRVGVVAVRPRSAGMSVRSLHYHSDGSGRDKYVKAQDGGLHSDYPDVSASHQFIASLRESTPLATRRLQPNDYFDWAQRAWTPRRGTALSRGRRKQAQQCVKRLTEGLKPNASIRMS